VYKLPDESMTAHSSTDADPPDCLDTTNIDILCIQFSLPFRESTCIPSSAEVESSEKYNFSLPFRCESVRSPLMEKSTQLSLHIGKAGTIVFFRRFDFGG
jgi:hypothetical protein